MKLSLSTNGWEKYGWDELFRAAEDAGFSGIELHGISSPELSGPGRPFARENIAATARHLSDIGFSVVCVDALCDIADGAFDGCTALTTVTAPAGGTAEKWAKENGCTFIAE